MRIKFELMDESHIDGVLEIEKKCFPDEPWTRGMFESELENMISAFLVGVDEDVGAVVCFGGMWLIADMAEITNIAVDPNHRRLGIGEKTLSLLCGICRERGVSRINLEVRDGNEAAMGLYKKFGFEPVGRRAKYYDNKFDAILMTKNLQRW